MKSGKIWGHTEELHKSDVFELHRLVVVPGGMCSKHLHNHKYNVFYVEEGDLSVEVWKRDYDLIDRTELQSGDKMQVVPGEFHRFRSDKGCVAYEWYFPAPLSEDIVRESCGSVTQDNCLETDRD